MIDELDVRCNFYKSHCLIQRKESDQVLGIGRLHKNLYILESTVENHFCNFFNSKYMTIDKWHVFLGHPSLSILQHVKGLSRQSTRDLLEYIQNCEICVKAKHYKDPYPILNQRSNEIFELIHTDVWGPYSCESVRNTKFVLTIVEDHRRMVWTFLLSSKDQVCSTLKNFILMVNTQFGKKVKKLRSDNGTKFVNIHVREMLNSFGIFHQRSCIRCPQQNGVVERRYKNLLSTSRALMFQSTLPEKFWPYSVLTATWMINRLPSRVLDWNSPYKLLYGVEQDLSVLRPFGFLDFAMNTHPSRGKFDSRSRKCVFLGYDANHKVYLLFDLDLSKLLISRDVKFDTSCYPFSVTPPSLGIQESPTSFSPPQNNITTTYTDQHTQHPIVNFLTLIRSLIFQLIITGNLMKRMTFLLTLTKKRMLGVLIWISQFFQTKIL